MLKIRKIETLAAGADTEIVYHISVAGVRLGEALAGDVIQHLPVSRETLDGSVTGLTDSKADFGDVDEGIAIWRADHGGIFTISVAEIVDVLLTTTADGVATTDQ